VEVCTDVARFGHPFIQSQTVPWRKILNSTACDISLSAFRTYLTQSDKTVSYQIDRAQLEAAKLRDSVTFVRTIGALDGSSSGP
jgi:hypothetical protein